MEYAKNPTYTRAEELKDLDLVWVTLGILGLSIIYVTLWYWARRHGCVFHIQPQPYHIPGSDGSEMTSIHKTSPPPPYEHPPSYAVAVSMENECFKVKE